MNPQKELLWGLWVMQSGTRQPQTHFKAFEWFPKLSIHPSILIHLLALSP